jgi:hypothetical protein
MNVGGLTIARRSCAGPLAAAVLIFAATVGLTTPHAQGTAGSPTGSGACRVSGRITGAGTALPGVAITVRRNDAVQGATSSGTDGAYRLTLPEGTYRATFELAGFVGVDREIAIDPTACPQSVDVTLGLMPRTGAAAAGRGPGAGQQVAAGAVGGRGAGRGFQALEVSADAAGEAALDLANPEPDGAGPALLLPPGFSSEAAADAIAVTGDAARVDRGALNDRLEAVARGDIPPFVAEAAAQFGISPEELAGRFGQAGRGGQAPGQGPGRGGPGRGGAGDFVLGGRGGRGARVTATADYTFGGSALDSSPYQLRSDAPREERPYTRQNFGGTIGGPLRIPGLYDGTNRSTFTLTYNGGRGSSLFDQYATVPTVAMRNGDFSSTAVSLVDPLTGAPFANNQIPLDRMSPSALALLQFIPEPNLPGTTRNYHYTTTTPSVSNAINGRVTHTLVGTGRGGPGGRGGRGGGGRAGGGRGRGAAQPATSVTLNAQIQYRRNHGDQNNVFATLGGHNASTSLGVPTTINVVRGRDLHGITVNFSRTASNTSNRFAGVQNVSSLAGIQGVATDPFAWGVPALSFSSITGLRDVTPSERSDRRLSTDYTWTRQRGRHTLRLGGDLRLDRNSSRTEANANGAFVFTGIHTSGGALTRGYADVADLLLGLPQQATVQYGPGEVVLSGRSISLFAMDDWRMRGNLTFNLGLRYELLRPFLEDENHLVNLDVRPDFTGAAPVVAGGTGLFTGDFPDALLRTDANNIAPRVGVAWRGPRNLVMRGGYGISYNAGSYSAIARQLASQPPFAVTNTRIAALNAALLMEDALSGGTAAQTTNTYGVDKDYVLGRVETWNVDVNRNLGVSWAVGANYTHTRGSSLDIVRAPNRDADGLRIADVQPFTWQSAEGSSVLNSASFRLQRRPVRGIGGQVSYTLAKSRDNAPSIGGGGGGGTGVMAQNDQDLESEWGLSNFDQRHRFNASVNVELPFGPNRRWLANGGPWAAMLEGWRLTTTFNADAGTPLTARVRASSRDVAQGLNGALRADYSGAAIAVDDPGIDRFFNTGAFSVPSAGLFGSSARNIIIGPGSRQLDGQLTRDVRLGGTRTVSIQFRANNLLNMVNYTSVDTWVNSPTFGQVLGVRPMRSAQLNLRFRF